MARLEIDDLLAEASVLINGSRNEQYGDYEDNWIRIGELWGSLLDMEPIPPHIVGTMLAAMKLSRIVSNPKHADNYVDAIAYIAGSGAITS